MNDNDTPDKETSGRDDEAQTTRREFMSAAAAMSAVATMADVPEVPETDVDEAPLNWNDYTGLEAEPYINIVDGRMEYMVYSDEADAVECTVESTTALDTVYFGLSTEEFGAGSNGFDVGGRMDPDDAQALAAKLYAHAEWLKRESDA